jgi:hypothetical protein
MAVYHNYLYIKITYHQEVGLWVLGRGVRGEDLRALQILGQRSAEVGILEDTQVLGLGSVRRANQARLNGQIGLAETTARK